MEVTGRMVDAISTEIPWFAPWVELSSTEAVMAELELSREVTTGHVLYGREAKAIGRRTDCEDFLFYLADAEPHFVVVHLPSVPEKREKWPRVLLFKSLDEWMERYQLAAV